MFLNMSQNGTLFVRLMFEYYKFNNLSHYSFNVEYCAPRIYSKMYWFLKVKCRNLKKNELG